MSHLLRVSNGKHCQTPNRISSYKQTGLSFINTVHVILNPAPLAAQMVKNLPAMWEAWVWSLGGEDPLEKGTATQSSILTWRIPWIEEPGGLQSMGPRRFGHETPLDCKEIQPVHSEGDQPWDFFGRNDAKAETPVLWPPHAKSCPIGKDSDAGRDWGQEEKGTTEDEMAGWHHWLDGRESQWTPGVGVGDEQGGLACCDSWGHKESDTTEWLIWSDLIWATFTFTFVILNYQMYAEKGSLHMEIFKYIQEESYITISFLESLSGFCALPWTICHVLF